MKQIRTSASRPENAEAFQVRAVIPTAQKSRQRIFAPRQ
jgi:hypothetical protein